LCVDYYIVNNGVERGMRLLYNKPLERSTKKTERGSEEEGKEELTKRQTQHI